MKNKVNLRKNIINFRTSSKPSRMKGKVYMKKKNIC